MLPKPLYDALPFLYLGTGSLVGGALESTLKLLPTTLFMAVGVYMLFRRGMAALEGESRGKLQNIQVRPLPANYVPRMPPADVEFCAGHALNPHSLLRDVTPPPRTADAGSNRANGH
jgi:hypothetical protein